MPATAFAADTPGSATLTGGQLAYTAPLTVAFAATLTGADQSVTAPQVFDVQDNTGSATGGTSP